jgi:glycerol-3-phosphate dehydrogenase
VVDKATVAQLEPNLAPDAEGGVIVPGEHVMDPWSAPLAYLRQAIENGAVLLRNAALVSASDDGAVWTLGTPLGSVRARAVVNCAGLEGDRVERLLTGASAFEIRPRKGQFVVFDKAAFGLVTRTILPVPTERTKGVILARTIFGNLLVGPTAEEQDDRARAGLDGETLRRLVAHGIQRLPALADIPVTASYAGLRPATERKEYRVHSDVGRRLVTLGGIRSTGLTGALGLARHAWQLYLGFAAAPSPLADPAWPRMPTLAENGPRDWQQPGYGEIVCHCELVTRREIEAALEGPLAAGDLGGLKRRTRAAMGRCQGFHCLARLATLTGDRLAEPLAVGVARHA